MVKNPCPHLRVLVGTRRLFGVLSHLSVLPSFSALFFCWESQCGLVNISSGHTRASVETEQSVTPERMPTFPLDASTVPCRGRRRAVLSPTSAPLAACSPPEPSHHAEERERQLGKEGKGYAEGCSYFSSSKDIPCWPGQFYTAFETPAPRQQAGALLDSQRLGGRALDACWRPTKEWVLALWP